MSCPQTKEKTERDYIGPKKVTSTAPLVPTQHIGDIFLPIRLGNNSITNKPIYLEHILGSTTYDHVPGSCDARRPLLHPTQYSLRKNQNSGKFHIRWKFHKHIQETWELCHLIKPTEGSGDWKCVWGIKRIDKTSCGIPVCHKSGISRLISLWKNFPFAFVDMMLDFFRI